MKKVVIVIPCWQRSAVVEKVVKQLDLFFNATKNRIDLTVVYVFSVEDPEIDMLLSIYLLANHHRDFIFSENKFLGRKLNEGIDHASKFNYDYIMNFGSDDLIHPGLIDLYENAIEREVSVFGIDKVFFWHENKPPVLFSSYNKPNLVGAGRMIHKRVIQAVYSRYGGLYSSDINRGMDTFSAHRMKNCGFHQTVIETSDFPFLVDIKSDVNINSFDKIIESSMNTGSIAEYEPDYIQKHYSELYAG